MATEPEQPLHQDSPARSFFYIISPIIAAFLVIAGLISGDPITIILGIVLGVYIWFTRHFRYEIFPDRLVIYYGKPRIKVIPLETIETAQVANVAFGGRGVMMRRTAGWPVIIRPTQPEEFLGHLEAARRRRR